jgi:hypothetical protein
MAIKFNPIGDPFDFIDTNFFIDYARVPRKVIVLTDASFRIESGGGVQIFTHGLGTAQGMLIQNNLTVKSDSSFIVESGSMTTVIGE